MLGAFSAKFCTFDIASNFAIPPNYAFSGRLEEFFYLHQRYKISITLSINPLRNFTYFRTVPTYPKLNGTRSHEVKPGTTIEEIVALYYYDFDLRAILNRYLLRIEVSVRTSIIYQLSVKYVTDQYWFVNPVVVSKKFKDSFDKEVYSHLRNKPTIKRHHSKYKGKYAPAWKTMEFMTMGNLETLYDNLILDKDKKLVSNTYGEPATSAFISVNRANDMRDELHTATEKLYEKVPSIRPMIEVCTGIILPEK